MDSANKNSGTALQILVIADAFPKPSNGAHSLHLMQILRSLRAQGHNVTLVMRENTHRTHYNPFLQGLGIQLFAGDKERLIPLGIEPVASDSWMFQDVFSGKNFDAAFLVQSFHRGISIPEQYLDDIRRASPTTRVAIVCQDLYCKHPDYKLAENTKLQKFEAEQDQSSREHESFERADLVIVSREADAVKLHQEVPHLDIAVLPSTSEVAEENLAGRLANVLAQIVRLTPKPPAQQAFSAMLVEAIFADRVVGKIGEKRILAQLENYARLAGKFLNEGKPAAARDQLRHIFGRTTGSMKADQFHAQVFVLLKRCYREMNRLEMAERCATEARQCAMREVSSISNRTHAVRPGSNNLLLSVIVPTYNRVSILKKCLAALEAQTLPANHFEVIVIDDGSSDGTEEFMRQYAAPFHFQYLRQKNSGTGAARCNGVSHATGEYLLLMNDDTICDKDVAEQHLRIQQANPDERWAVLGNFEYPAAARERALTHYFRVEPFMFPQVNMEEGCPYGYSYFITCNLTVRREAVVQAGSFDSTYKLSEDTELGLRLHERGYRVLYHPSAHAWHDHLPYPAKNLIRRARVYGADYFYMFRNYPRVMQEWAMPVKLTGMDAENALRIRDYVDHNRREIVDAVDALERWDTVDFEPILTDQPQTAAMVLGLFRQAVPAIHWFYLFETMLHTMVRELHLSHLAPEPIARAQTASRG